MKKRMIAGFMRASLLLVLAGLFACSEKPAPKVESDNIYDGLEFQMPHITVPTFPDYKVSVTDFGAVGDGQNLNTKAFAEAINDVAKNGGGTVVIPEGIWLTGPIQLKSNINIHADAGALVIFSDNKDLYPLIKTSFEGLNTVRCLSPIYGKDLENIAFTGEGVFDGSGDAWRQVKKSKLTSSQWKKLVASGGIVSKDGETWYPSKSFEKGAELSDMNVPRDFTTMAQFESIRDFLRPVMVSLVSCKNVLLDGPVFQNSPAWCLHPLMCENLTVRNVDVRNPWYSQNGDGIDIESCKNSAVYNCTFDVGDDAICIKSGKDADGRKRNMPTENLIVKNCTVFHGHGGVTVGSEMSGGVKNMHVSDCTFIGTDAGLRFKSNRGRGGVVEKIYISNINMIDIPSNAISFNLYYNGMSVSEIMKNKKDESKIDEVIPKVTVETPQFKDISIKNINCRGAQQAIYLQGLPEMNLKNVTMENLTMESKNGLFCMDADNVKIKNLKLKTTRFPAASFYNSKNVSISGLQLSSSDKPLITVEGKRTGKTDIQLVPGTKASNLYVLGKNVDAAKVKIAE
ncbi:glycoside hydrolase family 28 protein [Prolixibacter denitrificans]|uniref:Glycoside hydrolase n=1 Tax=Prolixibacter denitrificans TaxID=1541063 RepID=A0A2P8CL10_9BACT|nr:glycoside hydrolase family 28 protein [Prolixibacter denitrificans]PSK85668.1 polygalacturonase [Prolixibacter denitrificans]GET20287.1 glycoside hydrolase [Prolixibacter denitrificans]